jgi:muramoyltetrapeptide carboxypeptidase
LTLLIDPPNAPGHGRLWSHLASDASYDELHRFAASLGIPPRGFDRDHYDIPAERYDAVVAAGATPVSSRELIARLKRAGLRRRKSERLERRDPGRPLVRAPRLRHGDRVAVVSPSGPVPAERLAAGLDVLAPWGLAAFATDVARGRDERFTYLAADDAARTDDLAKAWCEPDVRAVFCGRGGYGAQRVVDLLDWQALAEAGPKVLVGFSDVTALHQAFATRLGLSTIHGPVISSLGRGDQESREQLRSVLFEPRPGLSLTPERGTTLVPGRGEGPLVGGNLALLAAEIGSGYSLTAAGSVVVLEDTNEPLYKIDRLVTQLMRAGWFDGVRGIALGDLGEGASAGSVRDLAVERLGPLGVPMISGVPVGHGPRNLAFPIGVPAVLDADAGTLELLEAPLV